MPKAPPRDRGTGPLTCVGLAGFEPTAPGTQSRCATKLRHSPPGPSSVVPISAERLAHYHPDHERSRNPVP